MVIQLLFLFIFLSFIFFLSHKISSLIYSIFYTVTKSKRVGIAVLALLLLPGTVIHEVSHFLVATVLRVPTGELTVIPAIDKKSNEVKIGKLMIVKTDPFRYTLIGLAPMLIGLLFIYLVGAFLIPVKFSIFNPPAGGQFSILVGYYLFFIISNTMFSSRKDLESLIIVAPITFLILSSLYLLGVKIIFDEKLIVQLTKFFQQLNYYLGISLVINFLVYMILTFFTSAFRSLHRRGSP